MKHRTGLALGMAGGYLLGRFRKTRWLVALAGLAAASRPVARAAQRAGTALGSSPEVRRFAEQGRVAAEAMVGGRIDNLSGRLSAVTKSLRQPSPDHQPEPEERRPEEEAREEQAGEEQAREEKPGQEQAREEQARESEAGEAAAGEEQAREEKAGEQQAGEQKAGEKQARESEAGDTEAGEERAGEERAEGEAEPATSSRPSRRPAAEQPAGSRQRRTRVTGRPGASITGRGRR
jgi:hypothetical protein